MENASKALLIAGGILIGILTITLFIYMFRYVASIHGAEAREDNRRRIAELNAELESYNKEVLYGNDVLTVINYVDYNNSVYADNDNYKIVVKVFKSKTSTEEYTKEEIWNDFKTNIFSCKKVEYNSETGRVNLMEFYFVR